MLTFEVRIKFGMDTRTLKLVAGGERGGALRFRETSLPAAMHGAAYTAPLQVLGEVEGSVTWGVKGLPSGMRVVEVRQTPAP